MPAEEQKRAAAEAAVAEVAEGMVVGLGTGSTAAFAIEALGRRVRDGLAVTAVATSERTAAAAAAAGIRVIDMGDVAVLDLAIDGVDEIDPWCRAIKGAGGAMLREKVIAAAARRMVAIADASKPVAQLGARPVPVEVLPLARAFVARAIGELGGAAVVRTDAAGAPIATDGGNPILDASFGPIEDAAALATALSAVPGILGHGLFVSEIDAVYVASDHGVEHRIRKLPIRNEHAS